jgi:subtilisin family serine protease
MRFRVPDGAVGIALLNGWYPGDSRFEVSLRTPGGFVTPWQKVISTGNPVGDYSVPDGQVQIVTPAPDPVNGDHNFFVQITGKGRFPVKGGVWQLRVRNTSKMDGKLDVWAIDDAAAVFFTGTSVKDTMKIGSPGASARAITVAAHTTKAQYTDIDGSVRDMGLEPDTISDFSSEGPLRNGAEKPDVAAPGAMIVSALSSDASFDRPSKISDKFVIMAGTSMATPFVTGIVALQLQRDPALEPEAVKELLRQSSSIPGQPAGTFDPKWGFGLIDALKL